MGTFNFSKNQSKRRQVISSKFPKSFRGARDLMVLGDFLKVWKNPKNHKRKPSNTTKLPPWNSSETHLKSPDGALIECWENKRFFIVLHGPRPTHNGLRHSNWCPVNAEFELFSSSWKQDNETEILTFKTVLKSGAKEPAIVTSGRGPTILPLAFLL